MQLYFDYYLILVCY